MQKSQLTNIILVSTRQIWVYFSSEHVPTTFAISRKKCLRPKWTTYKHESDKNKNVYLSVILEFCLSSSPSVARLQPPPVYVDVEAWNIYLKIPYFIQIYSNLAEILIFEIYCIYSLPYFRKKYHKNERHLRLITHSFTKLAQNVWKVIFYSIF